jgi:putative spermidine/putrescine transport system permease protein
VRRLSLLVIALVPVLPLGLLLVLSFARAWYWPAVLPREWSTRAWEYVWSPASDVQRAIGISLAIAVGVAVVSVLAAIPAARALALHRFTGKQAVILLLALPVIAPPIAATMGLHRMFLTYGLTDTALGVALSHLSPALPYAVLTLFGSFSRFEPDFESQARTLGAGHLAVWWHVTLPAIAPGIAVAFAFAFLVSWSQYLLTLLIGGGHVITLPLELVQFQRSGDEAIASALALVFITPAIGVALLVARYLRDA